MPLKAAFSLPFRVRLPKAFVFVFTDTNACMLDSLALLSPKQKSCQRDQG